MGLSNTGLILEGADDVVGLHKNGDETLLGEVARRVDQHGALHALDEVHHLHVQIRKEAQFHKDSYIQVIQVIQEKEKQKKFAEGTRQYKRNNLIDFALKENLKAFGWSINPPATRRERKSDKSLFDER